VPPDPGAAELSGVLAGVNQTFDNGDGTFTIIGTLEGGAAVRGPVEDRDDVKVGAHYKFLGRWDEHARYGWHFAFTSFVADAPADPEALAAYLARHCHGIGDATTRKLVAAHGADVVRLLIQEPERFAEEGLLSVIVAKGAAQTLAGLCDPETREAHLELFALFRGLGFPGKAIKAALKLWKAEAAARVRRDPFSLLVAEVPGCGFTRCDRLYVSLGLNPGRLKRQALAAWHAIKQRDGDTWHGLGDAVRAVESQIGGANPNPRRALALMARARWLAFRLDAAGGHWLAERTKAANERDVALRLKMLAAAPACWPVGPFDGLSDHQQQQLAAALSGAVAALTGSPGTGKTYTAASIIKALIARHGTGTIAVAAPTGKAAVRISEKMSEAGLPLQATTIHRLLKVKPSPAGAWRFEHDADNPLPHRFIVIDETTMVDVDLAASLLRACAPGTHLLLVGDVHQLPPVGHGAFLRDLITAGIPTATLTEIRRNAGRIVHACASMIAGQVPELPATVNAWPAENLVHVQAKNADVASDALDVVYAWLDNYAWRDRGQRWDPIDDVQVISARNATRQRVNRRLQEKLNPDGAKSHPVFRVGDKVICLRNGLLARADVTGTPQREYVANGDIGRVAGFRGRLMLVMLRGPDRLVAVPLGKADPADQDDGEPGATGCQWDLAYCCTTHKFQGSECPVVIVLLEACGKLGSRELLYTAISRAKELCIVVGDGANVGRHCKNVILPDRKTLLTELLRGEVAP
jgi:exodeoxyribonuclease V alpha subunit